jgi:ABC-type phosphate transport system substrate-binding protein
MRTISIKLILISFVAALMSFTKMAPAAGDYAVIVNKDNPIAALSAGEAKLYFLRKLKSRWPGINKNIRPVTRKSKGAERDAFYATILKMSESEVDNYFAERQFQNAEKLPDKVNSDNEVIAFVENEIGGIGFISSKSITPEVRQRVKIVLEF